MGSLCWIRTYAEQTLGFFLELVWCYLLPQQCSLDMCGVPWRNLRTKAAFLEAGGLTGFGNLWRTVATNILLETISNWQYVYLFLAPSEKKLCKWVFEENLVFEWHIYSYINMNLYITVSHTSGVHWQYLAIPKPFSWAGEVKTTNWNFSNLLFVISGCLFSAVRLTYWLFSTWMSRVWSL